LLDVPANVGYIYPQPTIYQGKCNIMSGIGQRPRDLPSARPSRPCCPSSPSSIAESPLKKPGFIPKHGGYEKLFSYQRAKVVYKGTVFCANVLAGLTRVAIRLLEGQLDRLEHDFVEHGGLRERMTRARLEFRDEAYAIEQRRHSARQALRESLGQS